MRPVIVTKQLAAADADGIALSQALAAAGDLVLAGVFASGGVATLDTQRRVSILSSADDSGLTWTIYGTNQQGVAISEDVAGDNGVAVATEQDFYTVTRVHGSGATAGTVEVGTDTTGSSPWFVPNQHITPFEMGFGIDLVSGSADWQIDATYDSPLMLIPIYQPGYNQTPPVPVTFIPTGLSGSADGQGSIIGTPILAWRLTITDGTGEVKAIGSQAGIRN